jgi:hypothetical protein
MSEMEPASSRAIATQILLRWAPAGPEAMMVAAEPALRAPGDTAHRLRLTLLTHDEFAAEARRDAVGQSRLHQDPADLSVAARQV